MKIQKISLFLLCAMPIAASYGMEDSLKSKLTAKDIEKINFFRKHSPIQKPNNIVAINFNSGALCNGVLEPDDHDSPAIPFAQNVCFYNSKTGKIGSFDKSTQDLGNAILGLTKKTVVYHDTTSDDEENNIYESWLDVAPVDNVYEDKIKNKYFYERYPLSCMTVAFFAGICTLKICNTWFR